MNSVTDFNSPENGAFSTSVNSFLPPFVMIPLNQDAMRTSKCIVSPGEPIKEGQVIARTEGEGLDSSSADIHSSIPGRVLEIVPCQFPDGRQGKAAKIALSGTFTYLGKKQQTKEWRQTAPSDLCKIFSSHGVVNTFDGCVPLAAQIQKIQSRKTKLVVLRLFDEDPSRTTESFIASAESVKLVKGAEIIARSANADGIIFVCEKKNPLPQQAFAEAKNSRIPALFLDKDTHVYPAGFMRQLIVTIKKNCTEKPFCHCSNHDLFIDTPTALSVYDAVVLDIPVITRYIHVTGDCLRAAAIMKVRIGESLRSLALQCGGFKKQPSKIVINGLVTGIAVNSLDIPVTKQVKSVTFLPEEDVPDQRFITCIRCGNCRRICPGGLLPDVLYRTFMRKNTHNEQNNENEHDTQPADFSPTAQLCSGCALCNSVCPARLPLCQTIALFKNSMDTNK